VSLARKIFPFALDSFQLTSLLFLTSVMEKK
jgi:hypothetical protein